MVRYCLCQQIYNSCDTKYYRYVCPHMHVSVTYPSPHVSIHPSTSVSFICFPVSFDSFPQVLTPKTTRNKHRQPRICSPEKLTYTPSQMQRTPHLCMIHDHCLLKQNLLIHVSVPLLTYQARLSTSCFPHHVGGIEDKEPILCTQRTHKLEDGEEKSTKYYNRQFHKSFGNDLLEAARRMG